MNYQTTKSNAQMKMKMKIPTMFKSTYSPTKCLRSLTMEPASSSRESGAKPKSIKKRFVIAVMVLLSTPGVVLLVSCKRSKPEAPVSATSITQPVTVDNPALSIDREYGEGYGDFKFGASLDQVERASGIMLNTPWSALPRAGEYQNADVRYIWQYLKRVKNPPLYEEGKVSASSYICFLFREEKLFGISLRFANDRTCPNHYHIFEEFANRHHLDIKSANGVSQFSGASERVEFSGRLNAQGMGIEFFEQGAVKPSNTRAALPGER